VTNENGSLLSISEQALRWWVVCNDKSASAEERREFGEWVARGPERVEAYLRVARLRAALARPDVRWPETPTEVLVRDALASPEEAVPIRPRIARDSERRSRAFARLPLALAASLLVVLLLGWLVLLQPRQFETKLGEQRSVLLADGSRVTLNTDSKIEVRMGNEWRVILLVKGQALFDVTRDPRRPFEVRTRNAVARAVGTQFDVDLRADRTVVTVVEGRVAMMDAASDTNMPLPVLSVGDRVVVRGQRTGELQHGVDVGAATAWTRLQIVVKGRPLGEVAAEFNRYGPGRIDIRSAALRAQEITATFNLNDPASFIAFIEGIEGAHIARDGTAGYIVTLDESQAPRD